MATKGIENCLDKNFDSYQLSKIAFRLYNEFRLNSNEKMNNLLIALMTMEEVPEFEMTEKDIRTHIDHIKKVM